MFGLAACGSRDASGEWYSDWDRAGGCLNDDGTVTWGIAADGEPLGLCPHFRERYVWVHYTAGWCSASRKQTQIMSRVIRRLPQDVDYAIVITSADTVFVPADRAYTQGLARRYGFAEDRTVAEADGGFRTVPQHLLRAPDGRTLFRYIGVLDESEILEIVEAFKSGRRQPQYR